ncbi:MAG: hypothetical protein M0Q44_20470 [Methylobacter sp.]|jgi:hypothetical protein|nr:hypothetical protein [Methylobacter sp.]
MIIGSGLIAHGVAPYFETSETACVYVAGISNPACTGQREFERESVCLTAVLMSVTLKSISTKWVSVISKKLNAEI